MKKLTLILTPLLFSLGLNAKDISANSTVHQYAKPGAPIDMHYIPQKVDINETADVNITLTSGINRGTISVLITLDENLDSQIAFDNNISYEIMPDQKDFIINLKVKSAKEGLYYIRLLTKVDKGYGTKLRSFAAPVYVGKNIGIKKKSMNLQMKALGLGENISVSKALETIEVIKE